MELTKNGTRMEKHITDCTKCDESVKNKYLLDDADNALICESDADSDDPLVECAKLPEEFENLEGFSFTQNNLGLLNGDHRRQTK